MCLSSTHQSRWVAVKIRVLFQSQCDVYSFQTRWLPVMRTKQCQHWPCVGDTTSQNGQRAWQYLYGTLALICGDLPAEQNECQEQISTNRAYTSCFICCLRLSWHELRARRVNGVFSKLLAVTSLLRTPFACGHNLLDTHLLTYQPSILEMRTL